MSLQPNILVIMADQMVPFLTGAYDHPVVQTPNLDRLVETGVRFDAAYTPYPLCTPTLTSDAWMHLRASLAIADRMRTDLSHSAETPSAVSELAEV